MNEVTKLVSLLFVFYIYELGIHDIQLNCRRLSSEELLYDYLI